MSTEITNTQRLDRQCKKADDQALTLATICDMILGENAPKRDDDTLIRAVRVLLNNQKP